MRLHHIILGIFIYIVFDLNVALFYAVFICYHLFTKGFLVESYAPRVVILSRLIHEFMSKKFTDNDVLEREISNFIANNQRFLNPPYSSPKLLNGSMEEMKEQFRKADFIAFLLFPFMIKKYFIYGRKIRQLKKILKQ